MAFYSIFGKNSSNQSATNNTESVAPDEDDKTVTAGENRGQNGRAQREFCIKWVFPMTGDKRKAIQAHHTMLGMMMKAYPSLIVIDNKAREHNDKKTMKSTEKHRPFEFYSDVRNSRNKSLICIHRIRTVNSLSELKDSWGVIEELKKHKAYVRTHAFGEKDREISHIGFLPGVHMINITKTVVKEEILAMLRKDNDEIPDFEIVQVGVDMGKGSKIAERTRAYEIQCLQKNASRLAKMLQSGCFRENPIYVPYRMKKSNPSVFKNAIKRQIKIMADQWVIKVQGFTPDMMAYAREKFLESWVESVVPTNNTNDGEWKLLVHRDQYKNTMKWLQENWIDIIDTIPTDIQPDALQEYPKIVSKNTITMDTNSEEGTVDTYGTILSSLYYGGETEDDVKSDVSGSEAATRECNREIPLNYAQVAKGNTSTVSQVSGWTEAKNDELSKLQEKHKHLESQFVTVTAELGEMKELLHQLLAQGKQAQNEPPSKKQAIFETPQRSDRRSKRVEEDMDMEHESAINDSIAGRNQHMQE